MIARRVIACLDLRYGRVVKGVRFEGLRDAGDPVELAARYEALGADELVILDVSATLESRGAELATVARVRRVLSIPLCVGGGVRTLDDARALLEAGADKVAVNSAAVARPELISEISQQLGAQCVVLALDAARRGEHYEVAVSGARQRTTLDAVAWARRAVALGAGEILATSIDRDGTREGYDLELVRRLALAVRVPVIASGGAGQPRDLVDAFESGADAVLVASLFHERSQDPASLKRFLLSNGVEVRT